MARIKREREKTNKQTKKNPCLSKGLRDLSLSLFYDKGDTTYVQKNSLGSKVKG